MGPSQSEVTALLRAWNRGDQQALDRLMPLVSEELHRVAGRFMAGERGDHTLQPTALVNEAYLRLIDREQVDWSDRAHFFAFAATVMRRILVDHSRGRASAKRGGGAGQVTLDEKVRAVLPKSVELLAVDEAMKKLAERDERQARVVEMRFFGGLTTGECSIVLGISEATALRDWNHAKAWLYRELKA